MCTINSNFKLLDLHVFNTITVNTKFFTYRQKYRSLHISSLTVLNECDLPLVADQSQCPTITETKLLNN